MSNRFAKTQMMAVAASAMALAAVLSASPSFAQATDTKATPKVERVSTRQIVIEAVDQKAAPAVADAKGAAEIKISQGAGDGSGGGNGDGSGGGNGGGAKIQAAPVEAPEAPAVVATPEVKVEQPAVVVEQPVAVEKPAVVVEKPAVVVEKPVVAEKTIKVEKNGTAVELSEEEIVKLLEKNGFDKNGNRVVAKKKAKAKVQQDYSYDSYGSYGSDDYGYGGSYSYDSYGSDYGYGSGGSYGGSYYNQSYGGGSYGGDYCD